MTQPRVLMTADTVGGVWTYALDMARGLASRGVDTSLVTMGPVATPAQQADAAAVAGLELIDTGLPLDWTATEPAEIAEAAAVVRGLTRRVKADIIHLNSPALAALRNMGAPVLGACHSCLATWWLAVRGGDLPDDFRWRSRAHWEGLMACDATVAPSAAFSEATRLTYAAPAPFVVHNGRAPPADAPARPRERRVLSAGRLWDAGKNIGVLDAAATRLPGRVDAAGPLRGPMGDQAALSNVRWLGNLTPQDLADAMAGSTIFASTALYEPFGLAVLEAAQAGCALVLSDIPTFRELWDGAAVFVDPHDDRALADMLERLLDDPARTAALAEAARRRADRYSLDAMVEGVLGLYRMLAPQRFAFATRLEAAE